MKRTCKKCQTGFDLDSFPLAGVIKGVVYRRHVCTQCYTESKQPRKDRMREWYLSIKKQLSCEECGNSDFRVLDFHHCNGKKSFDVSVGMKNGFSQESILAEIAKCRCLCSNCHRIETYEEQQRAKAARRGIRVGVSNRGVGNGTTL